MEIEKYEKAIAREYQAAEKRKQYLIGAIAAVANPGNQKALFEMLESFQEASYEAGRLRGHVQAHQLSKQSGPRPDDSGTDGDGGGGES